MKKMILILILLFIPSLVQAAPVNENEICSGSRTFDRTKYNYVDTMDGTQASLASRYPASNYILQCCYSERYGKNVCDIFENKEQSTETGGSTGSTGTTEKVEVSCANLKSTLTLIGHVVFIAKLVIPIIIIAFGMMDFFRAVVGSKDDEIKKSAKTLIFRALSGVIIFFLPAFIDLIFSWVSGWEENYKAQYEECFKCIWNVQSCK